MPSLTKVQTGFLEAVNPLTLASGTASAPIISFSNSTATGIFSPSAGVLGFSTGSTQSALTILADGKVGIGTTNPVATLTVVGPNGAGLRIDQGNYNYYGAYNHVFKNSGLTSTFMTIDNVGNVGIGTTAPLYNTHIYGSVNGLVSLVVANKLTDVSSRAFFALENDTGGQGSLHFTGSTFNQTGYARPSCLALYTSGANSSGGIAIAARNSSGYIDFYTGGNNQRAIIDNAGNVGIGTTNPSKKLHVEGSDILVNGVTIGRGDSSTNVVIGTGVGTATGASQSVFIGESAGRVNTSYRNTAVGYQAMYNADISPTNTAIGYQALYTMSGYTYYNTAIGRYALGALTSGTSNIAIGHNAGATVTTGSGNICIAAAGPSTGSSNILIGGSISGATGAENYNVIVGYVSAVGVTNNNIIFGDGQGNERLRINGSGNVGIGTTNPGAKLQVQGDAIITSSLSINGVPYTSSITYEPTSYFSIQQHLENNNLTCFFTIGGISPGYVTDNNTTAPYSKAALFLSYYEGIGDYISITPGETIYGEIWVKRNTGATGTAGPFFAGVAQYDKDKNPIAGNIALNYFVASSVTIPTNSTWTRYSGVITPTLSHTPYNGSDGGPVRYIRPYIIVNYAAGTIPTYVTGFSIKKQGVFGSENVGIGTNNPTAKLDVRGWTNITSASVDSNWNSQLLITGNATYQPKITLSSANGYRWSIRNDDPTGNGELKFRYEEGSLEALTITRTGNVGIGTANPSVKFHAYGSNTVARIESSSTYVDLQLSNSASSQAYIQYNSSTLNFFAASGSIPSLSITGGSPGNVGIGSAAPTDRLHVYGSNSNIVISNASTGNAGLLIRYLNGTNHGTNLLYNPGSAITYLDNTYPVSAGTVYGDMYFRQNVAGTMTERITIKGYSGNVGIGTNQPLTKFFVKDGSSSMGFAEYNGGATIWLDGADGDVSGGDYFNISANNSQQLAFGYAGGANIVMSSTGNLGIGTTDPDTKLDVRGSIAAAGRGLNVPHVVVKSTNGGIRYFEYYFDAVKPNGIGSTATVNIISVANLSNFHQAAFTVEYGTRLQGVSDSTTSVCLKQFGVNKFNSGNVAITDTNDIASDTNSNTHGNVTCVTNGASGYIIRVEFSASAASSSFCSGVIRGWGVNDTIPNITFTAGP